MSYVLDTPLHRQLVSMLSGNREDSYATQRKRGDHLGVVATTLHFRFGLQKWENLKKKHVDDVIDRWKESDRGRRSIDEKLSHLRWLVRKIGKANLIPKTNAELGIEPGARHTRAGKVISKEDLEEKLLRVSDPHVREMMMLGRSLGLRFEEAALFRPWRDWQGDVVWVKRGTKGGRPRYLFIHNRDQVAVLESARRLTRSDRGLIPDGFATYEQWRQHAYRVLREVGIGRATDTLFHDLRRTYIVERMDHLLKVRRMPPDRAAALVSREVGHHRTEVLRWYLDAA